MNEIKKPNKFDWSNMKPTDIHGKDYYMVHERVLEFHRRYPDGVIQTEVVEMSNDRFITTSKVFPYPKEFPNMFCQGTSWETIGSNSGFKGSELECCETSSVGRALGFLCIGIKHSISSADEVKNAKANNKKSNNDGTVQMMSKKQEKWITTECAKKGIDSGIWTPTKTSAALAQELIDEICLGETTQEKATKLFNKSNEQEKSKWK